LLFALFALLGGIFAAVSTYDFVAHLDRQVHAIDLLHRARPGSP